MKLVIFMTVASVAVMIVLIAQVVRQELIRRHFRDSALYKDSEITRKEDAIAFVKKTFLGLKPKLLAAITFTEELKRKKDALLREQSTLDQNLSECKKATEGFQQKKAQLTESFAKQKNEHAEAKENAQKTIEQLKQQILDREKAICALVDTTNAEARKLCGLGAQ